METLRITVLHILQELQLIVVPHMRFAAANCLTALQQGLVDLREIIRRLARGSLVRTREDVFHAVETRRLANPKSLHLKVLVKHIYV